LGSCHNKDKDKQHISWILQAQELAMTKISTYCKLKMNIKNFPTGQSPLIAIEVKRGGQVVAYDA
jgi:hypothetical protein